MEVLQSRLESLERRKFSLDGGPEYPFISCVHRMLFAFGDTRDGLLDTYKGLHDFIEDLYCTS